MTEQNRYSTKTQRDRTFINLLDEKLESIRLGFCDKQHVDESRTVEGLRQRNVAWRLGPTEFHMTYTEIREQPGSASYRLRVQPYNPKGVSDEWEDIQTLGEFDGILRQAKKLRGPNPGDIRAQRNANIHEGAIPQGLLMVGLSGSVAYGLDHGGYDDPLTGKPVPPSDVDLRGVFAVPTLDILSLGRHKELVEQKVGADTVFDEVERFMELCLMCNPERLEMLSALAKYGCHTKTQEEMNALTQDDLSKVSRDDRRGYISTYGLPILQNRDMFMSRRLIKTYGGYAKQQMYRIESREERKTKPAMHLIRLMMTGIRALNEGVIDCDMSEYRDEMMAIRTGEMPIEDVFKWHAELEADFAKAIETTKLPEHPDRERANKLLLDIRKRLLVW